MGRKKLYIILYVFILVVLSSFVSATVINYPNVDNPDILYYNDFEDYALGSTIGNWTGTYTIENCDTVSGKCLKITGNTVYRLDSGALSAGYDTTISGNDLGIQWFSEADTLGAREIFIRTIAGGSYWMDAFKPDGDSCGGFASHYTGSWLNMGIGNVNCNVEQNYTINTVFTNAYVASLGVSVSAQLPERGAGSGVVIGLDFTTIDSSEYISSICFWNYTATGERNCPALAITETGNFSITAVNSFNVNSINNFSVFFDGILYNTSIGTVTTGLSNSTLLKNITVSSIGYFNKTYLNYNVSSNLIASLDPFNSISITIRNEQTNNLIYDNTSIRFQNNQSETIYYTNTSSLFVSDFDSGEYQITFNVLNASLNYNQKSYTITVSNSSTSVLNAYLTQNSSTTVFTVSDKATAGLLDDVLATSYKMINNTWVVVESGLTDITGSISFQYLPFTRYKYFLAKSGYFDYIFYLNPVTSPTYTIDMDRVSQINESQDYDRISLVYAPTLYYDGRDNNFTFLIQSPYGDLLSYGYDLTFPGGTASNSGTNSIGAQLYNNFTITGANIYDTVKVSYYYDSGFAGRRDFTYYYPISLIESTGNNNTMIQNKDKTYGLGLFERLFFAVFIVCLVIGIATLIGQPIAGMGMGMMIYGYFVYVGLIPLWSILISVTLGLLIIGSRPGG